MSYEEFLRWTVYRNQFGSLNLGMRVDRAVARALTVWVNSISKGKKYKLQDFSPYDQAKNTVDLSDAQSVFKALKGVSNGVSRDPNP